jgi:uncharacterized membrane protein YbhN (UPF0104 family)
VKKFILTLLKIGISVGILAYLVYDAYRNNVFAKLQAQPKDWWLLSAAAISCSSAVLLTLIRWYYLVRALDLPFTFRESLRLGFLGYLFNLAPMGIVGGDLLKAVMLARQQHGHRAEAVATVFIDRIIGLYMLFVVASVAILLTGMYQLSNPKIQWVCILAVAATVIGTVALALMLLPDLSGGKIPALIGRIPCVGQITMRLVAAVGMYRKRMGVLIASAVMSAGVHSLYTLGIYMITRGLYSQYHSLAQQFVIATLTAVTGVLPVSFGPFEYALDRMFCGVPLVNGGHMTPGQGLVVALGYRIITVLTAAIGVAYYLASRAEVSEVLADVEDESEVVEQVEPADSLA